MQIIFYVVVGLFLFISLGNISAYAASRHIGTLLASLVFGAAVITALVTGSWWPLGTGLAVAFVLRWFGLDPSSPRR
jgi:hypothetical protein